MQHGKIGRDRALVGRYTAVIGTKRVEHKRYDERSVGHGEEGDGQHHQRYARFTSIHRWFCRFYMLRRKGYTR